MKRKTYNKLKLFVAIIIITVLAFICFKTMFPYPIDPSNVIFSSQKIVQDFNQNGKSDAQDFVIGARKYMDTEPEYDGRYCADGYPPEEIGVCTDVIWNAFKEAGYSLRDMVDADIQRNIEEYPATNGIRDYCIDFRRVPNLKIFFEKYAQSLTLDVDEKSQWLPGDIITYGTTHIAIISDKKSLIGYPYIIHQSPNYAGEVNRLKLTSMNLSGHYRFDADKIPKDILIAFEE